MHVLLISSSLNTGGVETHVAALARSLRNMGHQVSAASSGGAMVAPLGKLGVRHHLLDRDSPDSARMFRTAARLAKILRKTEVDVVHLHDPAMLGTTVFGALQARRPWTYTNHGVHDPAGWMWHLGPWHFALMTFLLRNGPVLAVSRNQANYLQHEFGIPGEKIEVIPNGIDLDQFAFQRSQPLDRGPLRLLYVSRLDDDKRNSSFGALELMRCLHRLGVDPRLTIAGDGVTRAELEAAASQGVLSGRVRFLGARVDGIPELMHQHDAVIGWGRAVLEAFATGRPALVAGLQGLVALVSPANREHLGQANYSGRQSPAGSPEEIAGELLELLRDPQMLETRAKTLRDFVERHHDELALTKRRVELYEHATAAPTADTEERTDWLRVLEARDLRLAPLPEPVAPRTRRGYEAMQALARSDFAAAEAALRELLRDSPADLHVLEALGGLLLRVDRAAEAVRFLAAAVEAHAGNESVRYLLGKALLCSGQEAAAMQVWREAHVLFPHSGRIAAAVGGTGGWTAARLATQRARQRLSDWVGQWRPRG